METQEVLVLSDGSLHDAREKQGARWRLFTDGVMGGVSTGDLTSNMVDDRRCMRLSGNVSLENNGGFVQVAFNTDALLSINVEKYQGFVIDVYGNSESYNMHLRTDEMRRPWQSYRSTFHAGPSWQAIFLPFSQFEAHRIEAELDPATIRRVGIVAIGREFSASICIGRIALYN